MGRGRTFSGANKIDASRLRRDMYGKTGAGIRGPWRTAQGAAARSHSFKGHGRPVLRSASAPPHIRNEAGDRFEAYVRDLLNTALPGFQSTKGDSYAIGKKPMNDPDVMVRDGDTVVAVVESRFAR